MLEILLQMESGRLVRDLSARGHINGSIGSNLGCAAASVLVRTFTGILEITEGVITRVDAQRNVFLTVKIERVSDDLLPWFSGISDFLVKGLYDLYHEYPDQFDLQVNNIKE